jgi:O-antigen ligase
MLVVAGISVLALVALARNAPSEFLGGRLAWPTGYSNATASLWLVSAFPAVALSIDRTLHWALRGAVLGAATLLLATSVLSQSRGAAGAALLTAIVLVALVPRRWPALGALGLVGLAVAVCWDRLTAVREARAVPDLLARSADARTAVLLAAVAVAILAAAAAYAGARLAHEDRWIRVRRLADRALALLAALVVVAGVVALALSPGWVERRWDDFRAGGYEQVESGTTRFTGELGSNRYDFYRVALDEFQRRPLAGTGADNFAVAYLRDRRSPESPRYPHSLLFQLLAGLGTLGTAAFGAFGVAVLVAFGRRQRQRDTAARVAAAGALTGGAVWLLHGLADWLWMFPALGLLAFALLGLAARGGGVVALDAAIDVPRPPAVLRSLPVRAGAIVAALGLALSFALPGIAARFTSAALEDDHTSARDLDRLERAADFEPLSAQPLLALAVVARRAGDPARAHSALLEAVDREPENWFAWFELGLADAGRGDRDGALESIARAAELNPRQPVVADVGRRVAAGERVDPEAVEAKLSDQLRVRLQAVDTRQ